MRSRIEIKPIDGEPLGWTAEWKPESVTITPLEGKELVNETTYIITIRLEDAAGNAVLPTITFTTE